MSDLLGGACRHNEGLKAEPERPPPVCRMDGKTRGAPSVTGIFETPNGLAFSPDERPFYIIDAGLAAGRNTSADVI